MIELIITTAAIILSAYFSFQAGKDSTKVKHQEDLLDAIEKARKARGKLNDPEYVNRLLNKYKR